MPRKVTMPGSPDVLRGTDPADRTTQPDSGNSRGTGRVRHDDKITVYVSRAELVRLEQARLTLRAEHGLSFDRGRIVREAVAAALDDLEARGPDAELLRRLGES
ncbi:hypothetical protein AADG42_12140 [Ammonicoccus fulvus]|uniref:Cobyrinic acid a,c-diamide synthase n=1 Tax=Ammonicoccus fulvus TaxID=3138240 RepID=A0ABZ3FPN1_9ACTN